MLAARIGRFDALGVVTDLALEEAVDPGDGQLLADPGGVGVDDLPEEQLGPDGDDLAAHGGTLLAPHPDGVRARR